MPVADVIAADTNGSAAGQPGFFDGPDLIPGSAQHSGTTMTDKPSPT
ncbi:hypothetical protein ACFQYP_32805 [Nonomuraea antimicrobica]